MAKEGGKHVSGLIIKGNDNDDRVTRRRKRGRGGGGRGRRRGAVKRFSGRYSAIEKKKTFVLKLGETWTDIDYLSRFYRSGKHTHA